MLYKGFFFNVLLPTETQRALQLVQTFHYFKKKKTILFVAVTHWLFSPWTLEKEALKGYGPFRELPTDRVLRAGRMDKDGGRRSLQLNDSPEARLLAEDRV